VHWACSRNSSIASSWLERAAVDVHVPVLPASGFLPVSHHSQPRAQRPSNFALRAQHAHMTTWLVDTLIRQLLMLVVMPVRLPPVAPALCATISPKHRLARRSTREPKKTPLRQNGHRNNGHRLSDHGHAAAQTTGSSDDYFRAIPASMLKLTLPSSTTKLRRQVK
jgi:hypothetical protein